MQFVEEILENIASAIILEIEIHIQFKKNKITIRGTKKEY